jgi:tRNA threonylcarbamoyladenosine biosynthesis protein TsaB
MRILALDTATEACSVALLADGRTVTRELETERGHAERILPMIDEVLTAGGVSLAQLDAIAFGRGPGAFTGVRLAASVAQGLAFGAGLPVVPISDLAAVAQRVLEADAQTQRVLVCNDARMHEVYWACFERDACDLATRVGEERVSTPGDVTPPAGWRDAMVVGAGRGFRAYPDLRTRLAARLAAVHDLLPRAAEIVRLAAAQVTAGRVVRPEEALPVYLRDNVATPQRKD